MGMFPSAPTGAGSDQQPKAKTKKKKEEFEEVFDHLEEPEFDPEEMQRTAHLLRQRQQEALASRQKQRYQEANDATRKAP